MGRASRPGVVEPARLNEILERLAPLAQEFVLIGGQAVHYWTQHYQGRVPELQREAPYTTRDVDFCGTAAQARECARVLGATCREYSPDDRSPCTAIIELGDVQIDFLHAPFGLPDVQQLRDRSIAYEHGRVMHPMHMLESRTANITGLAGYDTDRSRKQLRGAILCMHELLLDTLDQLAREPRAVRSALQLSERIFRLAESEAGVRTQVDHGLDVLDAVTLDGRMPEAFVTYRYPQARAQVETKRLQLRRSLEATAEHALDAKVATAPELPTQRTRRSRRR